MKYVLVFVLFFVQSACLYAQCSICTKTAQQLGDGPAHGLNTGIIYLAFIPLLIMGYIGFRWWKSEKSKSVH